MKHVIFAAVALCSLATACSVRPSERSLPPPPPAPAPATVVYIRPGGAPATTTTVYTR